MLSNFKLASHKLQVGLAWNMVQGKDMNLDVSCAAISRGDQVALQDTVYSMPRPPIPVDTKIIVKELHHAYI
jgi:hypothetical protein